MKKAIINYILIFCISFTIYSCQKSAKEYYNIAVDYRASNNLISALEYLNKAIEVNPNFAKAYLERGQIRNSIYSIRYSTINNEAVTSHSFYKEIQLDTSFQVTMNDFNKALELDPKLLPKVQVARGNVFFTLNNYPRAITEYQKVLQLDSTNKEASINAVTCNLFLGDSIEASLLLDQMVQNDPNNAESYYLRAEHKLIASDYKENENVCEDLVKALELYDVNHEYLENQLKRRIKSLLEINCNKQNN